jgi:CarD family transcriptional regulator
MFHVGELIIYSAHGVCQIDDICEKTFLDETRTYYVIHPLEDPKLTINIPTDYESEAVLQLIERDDAENILNSFGQPGIEWIENGNQRAQIYHEIINTGSRQEISKVVNTLMRRKHEAESNGKKLGQADLRTLSSVQKILFAELAISLETSFESIAGRVSDVMKLK